MHVPRPLALVRGVANVKAIRENFIREIRQCQPFAKIFSREINPLYGSNFRKVLNVIFGVQF